MNYTYTIVISHCMGRQIPHQIHWRNFTFYGVQIGPKLKNWIKIIHQNYINTLKNQKIHDESNLSFMMNQTEDHYSYIHTRKISNLIMFNSSGNGNTFFCVKEVIQAQKNMKLLIKKKILVTDELKSIIKVPNWKHSHRLSYNLASLGINGEQLRAPFKTLNTIVL